MSDVFINKYLLKFLTWLFDLTKLSGQFNSEEDVNFKANVKIKYGPKGKCNVSHEDGEFELQFNFYDEIESNIIWISDILTLTDNKSMSGLLDYNFLEFSKFYSSNLSEQLFGTGFRNWNSDDFNVINTDSGYLIILRGLGIIGFFLFVMYIGTLILFLLNYFYTLYTL